VVELDADASRARDMETAMTSDLRAICNDIAWPLKRALGQSSPAADISSAASLPELGKKVVAAISHVMDKLRAQESDASQAQEQLKSEQHTVSPSFVSDLSWHPGKVQFMLAPASNMY